MNNPVTVRPVSSRSDLRRFVHLPYRLYAGHPYWVPPPLIDQKALLDRKKHPFYHAAEAEFFLAERDGAVVGRVAAIHNRAYNEFHGDRTGFFGFFETEDSPETTRVLLDQACAWLAGRGLQTAVGPVSPSTNYECGLLVEGFDEPPTVMMPYNPPGYASLLEQAGFVKAMDLLTYWMNRQTAPMDKINALADWVARREQIVNRPIDMKDLNAELDRVFAVYNDAWSRNWGFVPMSKEELRHMAAAMKLVCDPRIIFITEKAGEPVGFLLALPDLNQIFRKMGGRLLPFGWIRLLWGKRRLHQMRVLAMGFRRDHQKQGYTALVYRDIIVKGGEAGYPEGEIGWVLENNVLMNRAAAMLGARVNKRYRLYQRTLDG